MSDPRVEAEREKSQTYEAKCWQIGAEMRRGVLYKAGWQELRQAADGLGMWVHRRNNLRLIHSIAAEQDGEVWAHVSVSRADRKMPTWEQLRDTWRLIYPEQLAIVVIPPAGEHVNMAEVAHAWGCLTARPIPDFTHGLATI